MKQNLLTKVLLLCALIVGSSSTAWAEDVEIFSVAGDGNTGPDGWTVTISSANSKSGYWHLVAGGTEYVQTKAYDLSNYASAKITAQVATFGSGSNPHAKIQISYDGGQTFTETTTQGDPTSSAYVDISYSLLSVSDNVVIRVSNSISTGRGLRFKNFKLTATTSQPQSTVTAPVLSEDNNAQLAYGTNVTITNYNSNYVYFYTIDGTAPDCDADLNPVGTSSYYSTGITINSDVTVKVIAADIEGNKSSVTTATYTVIRPTAPILSPAAGKVEENTVVSISNKNNDYLYFYTDDNSAPTVSDLAATGTTKAFPDNGVTISEATTLKVIAVDENGLSSDVVTAAYTIGTPAQTTIDLRGVTTALEFSPGAFTSSGSGYQSYDDVTYTGSNDIEYSGWKLENVMHSGSNMQLRKSDGKVTMPTILTDAGFTITVTATTSSVTVSNGSSSGTNTLNESATSSNITIKAGSSYAVISKIKITPNVVYNVSDIAGIKELESGSKFTLDLTGAQVVFFDGSKNLFVRDNSGAILLYDNGFSTTLTTGDILSGVLKGSYEPYNGLPEVKKCDISNLSKTSNETVVAKEIEGTTTAVAANLCDLVKIKNTEITKSSNRYYVGVNSDIQLFDGFSVGYTVTTGKAVDVSGLATVYSNTYELYPRFETDIVYLDESEEVSIPEKGYITFCSENALDFSSTDAIAVYTAKVEEGKVVMTQIYKVPAEEGVILMNAQGLGSPVAATNVPILVGDADNVQGNELKGVLENTPLTYSSSDGKFNYVLQQKATDNEPQFYKATNGTLRANRAYLSTDFDVTTTSAPALSIDWGEGTTGIQNIERTVIDNQYYTLDGRRVAQPTKGLYIINGRKVVVK